MWLDTLRTLFARPYRAMPYADYLRSAHWQDKRAGAIRRAGGRCERCGRAGRLDVHHITYARLGCEADGDLVALCRACHEVMHEYRRLAK